MIFVHFLWILKKLTSRPILGRRGHMNRGCSGDGGLTPRPIPPGGKIELAPFPPLIVVEGGSILVPKVKYKSPYEDPFYDLYNAVTFQEIPAELSKRIHSLE